MKTISQMPEHQKRSNLSFRLLFLVILCSSFFTLMASIYQLYFYYQDDVDTIHDNLAFLQKSYLLPISGSLYALDYEQLDLLLQSVIQLPDLEYIEILEIRGSKEIKRNVGDPNTRKDIVQKVPLLHSTPISNKPQTIGTLTVVASFENIYKRIWEKTFVVIVTNAVKTFLASFCIMIIFRLVITRHLVRIARFTQQMELKKQYVPLVLDRKTGNLSKSDEFDQLVWALNNMQERISLDIEKREAIERELREAKERLTKFMESATDGFILLDSEFNHLEMNKVALEITGLKQKDVIGKNIIDTVPNIQESSRYDEYKKVMKTGVPYHIIDLMNHPLTGDKHIELKVFKVGEGLGIIFTDITERKQSEKNKKKLEARLLQAQKMESIGTLAGGIAHDFNNILFPIVGHTEMLLQDASVDSPIRSSLNQIYTGAMRASELVKQILTFSRQESGELKLMKMQPIKEALKLIRSTIPTTIEIKQNISPACGVIKADPTKIHQIVMNLATNAYHAMEETGGELKVSLNELELSTLDLINPDMATGGYVCLTVADTGKGMDKNIINQIFDPFFTTKKKSKGTGLGLSVIHGIVTSMNGAIQVYSEPGKGTVFNIYLPVEKSRFTEQISNSNVKAQRGTEKILLVDDEEAILSMEKLMLERLGYHVTSRTSSIEALEAFRAAPDKFNLVITDMAMPNMPGNKLSVALIRIRPDIPVLLCTGFSETMSEEQAASIGIKGFLWKPIVMKDLSQKIREVLDKK